MFDVIIIYNPLAGPANFAAVLEQISKRWRELGVNVTIMPTEAAGHATKLASDAAASGCKLVLAAGGDGTLREVVNGLVDTETIMGILPAGTANSFARELHMPVPSALQMPVPDILQKPFPAAFKENKLISVSDTLLAGRVQAMDIGSRRAINKKNGTSQYWMLWTGTGADSHLVHELEPRPKWSKKIGWASYVLQGIPVLTNFSHVRARVEVDGHTLEDDYILVLISNSRRYAGGMLNLSPEAYLDDGLFEIWLFGGHGLTSISRHAFRALRGQHLEGPDTVLLRGRHVMIHTDPPTAVQMDGDPAGMTPLECEVKPGAIRLLVPDSAPTDLFQQRGVPLKEAIG